MIESEPVEISRVAKWNHLHPQTLEKQYKEKLSDFLEWETKINPEILVYPENFGERMSIDETALHNGDLYTVITNKDAHGRKGSLAALIKGTKNEIITDALRKRVPVLTLMNVREITTDLAQSMDWICRENFMNAKIVADRFHTQQLVSEGVQEIRIDLRRKAIDEENKKILEAKAEGKKHFYAKRYKNGDTEKQLLARSRYLLFKPNSKWTVSQIERATLLFEQYPQLKQAYHYSMAFRNIFETSKTREEAKIRIEKWSGDIEKTNFHSLVSAANSINVHLGKILNYFPDRATNASAESFNAKLKGFRSLVRGVRDINFFLFRIKTFYS